MDTVFLSNLLKWVHLSSMAIAIGTALVCSMLAARAVKSGGEGETLWKFYDRLGPISFIAFIVLLVSGPLLFWVKYQFAWLPPALWIKFALIVVLIVAVVFEERSTRRVRAGDASAIRTMEMSAYSLRALELAIILAAVWAFN
jgi:hypothetical protein